jgi:hypothetical protein
MFKISIHFWDMQIRQPIVNKLSQNIHPSKLSYIYIKPKSV